MGRRRLPTAARQRSPMAGRCPPTRTVRQRPIVGWQQLADRGPLSNRWADLTTGRRRLPSMGRCWGLQWAADGPLLLCYLGIYSCPTKCMSSLVLSICLALLRFLGRLQGRWILVILIGVWNATAVGDAPQNRHAASFFLHVHPWYCGQRYLLGRHVWIGTVDMQSPFSTSNRRSLVSSLTCSVMHSCPSKCMSSLVLSTFLLFKSHIYNLFYLKIG